MMRGGRGNRSGGSVHSAIRSLALLLLLGALHMRHNNQYNTSSTIKRKWVEGNRGKKEKATKGSSATKSQVTASPPFLSAPFSYAFHAAWSTCLRSRIQNARVETRIHFTATFESPPRGLGAGPFQDPPWWTEILATLTCSETTCWINCGVFR
jgi:hypothetical protein